MLLVVCIVAKVQIVADVVVLPQVQMVWLAITVLTAILKPAIVLDDY
jgi:hypothetical protein